MGIDLTDVFIALEEEGVEKFAQSWRYLLEATQGQFDTTTKRPWSRTLARSATFRMFGEVEDIAASKTVAALRSGTHGGGMCRAVNPQHSPRWTTSSRCAYPSAGCEAARTSHALRF